MLNGRGCLDLGNVGNCVEGFSLTTVSAAGENQLNILLPSPHRKDPCLTLGNFCGFVFELLANLTEVASIVSLAATKDSGHLLRI